MLSFNQWLGGSLIIIFILIIFINITNFLVIPPKAQEFEEVCNNINNEVVSQGRLENDYKTELINNLQEKGFYDINISTPIVNYNEEFSISVTAKIITEKFNWTTFSYDDIVKTVVYDSPKIRSFNLQ